MLLTVTLKYSSKEVPILEVVGDIDYSSIEQLTRAIESLVTEGYTEIALALERVDYMDSSGLRALLDARRLLTDKGGKILLIDPSPRVMRLLSITKLLSSFSIVSSDSI